MNEPDIDRLFKILRKEYQRAKVEIKKHTISAEEVLSMK